MGSVSVSGLVRQYNLSGLQENSEYTITIMARNQAGSSTPVQMIRMTLGAGMFLVS